MSWVLEHPSDDEYIFIYDGRLRYIFKRRGTDVGEAWQLYRIMDGDSVVAEQHHDQPLMVIYDGSSIHGVAPSVDVPSPLTLRFRGFLTLSGVDFSLEYIFTALEGEPLLKLKTSVAADAEYSTSDLRLRTNEVAMTGKYGLSGEIYKIPRTYGVDHHNWWYPMDAVADDDRILIRVNDPDFTDFSGRQVLPLTYLYWDGDLGVLSMQNIWIKKPLEAGKVYYGSTWFGILENSRKYGACHASAAYEINRYIYEKFRPPWRSLPEPLEEICDATLSRMMNKNPLDWSDTHGEPFYFNGGRAVWFTIHRVYALKILGELLNRPDLVSEAEEIYSHIIPNYWDGDKGVFYDMYNDAETAKFHLHPGAYGTYRGSETISPARAVGWMCSFLLELYRAKGVKSALNYATKILDKALELQDESGGFWHVYNRDFMRSMK